MKVIKLTPAEGRRSQESGAARVHTLTRRFELLERLERFELRVGLAPIQRRRRSCRGQTKQPLSR